MGLSVTRDDFSDEDIAAFSAQVRDQLDVLKHLLEQPGFGEGPSSLGAELEYYLIDQDLNPLPRNQEVLQALDDPQFTVELNRFNLEYNLTPHPFSDQPFAAMEADLERALERIDAAAGPLGGRAVPIGILPTLSPRHFNGSTMTDLPRYRALARALRGLRGAPFEIHIDGAVPLDFIKEDVTLEGANTSFQVHWRVEPRNFAAHFNAVQLMTPLAVALGANSPSLFGHLLWDETRIALFKQAIDSRAMRDVGWHEPPRVSFGEGWARLGAWELFAESLALYPPLLPVIDQDDPWQAVRSGTCPALNALRLHQGTTWPWNRAVFDPASGGHLRIEMRALPSGPTPADMSANALFLIGGALALIPHIDHLTAILPFRYAEQNFYRAAKFGIDASLIWPASNGVELRERPILEIARELLPQIREALGQTALAEREIGRLLDLIQGRIDGRVTPARWQRRWVEHFQRTLSPDEAFRAMLSRYLENQEGRKPLCEWSLAP